jgi:hypothetical protein
MAKHNARHAIKSNDWLLALECTSNRLFSAVSMRTSYLAGAAFFRSEANSDLAYLKIPRTMNRCDACANRKIILAENDVIASDIRYGRMAHGGLWKIGTKNGRDGETRTLDLQTPSLTR